MIIANPIYDVVFKYLLEDKETEDNHQLNFKGDLNDPLVQKIVARLERAIASEEMRDKMDVEDEIDRIFERELSKLALEKDKIIAAKEQELEAERQKAEELLKELAALRKQMKK